MEDALMDNRRAIRRLLVTAACCCGLASAHAQAPPAPNAPEVAQGNAQASTSCERLAARALPDTTIVTAEAVTGGSFTPPGPTNAVPGLPPFCRVAGVMAPTRESHIL